MIGLPTNGRFLSQEFTALRSVLPLALVAVALVGLAAALVALVQPIGGEWLLHVSYDPTRELYRSMNKAFVADVQRRTGKTIVVRQSHSGSAAQARAVMEGLPADVLSLAIVPDMDAVASTGLVDRNWRDRLPHRATPFHSTIVFVVRAGNPNAVRDWTDLVDPSNDVRIVTPNPKTSGNGKLSLLAAWGAAVRAGRSPDDADQVVKTILQRTPVLDASARAATATFAQKNIGDVHLTFEAEAVLEVAEGQGALEIVHPKSGSLRVEPPLALVDRTVRRRGTETLAKDYLNFVFSPEGQRVGAELFYRPSDAAVAAAYADRFASIELFTLEDVGLDWKSAQERFFASGALVDRIAAELAEAGR
jgi:sulfate/thiosulfate-binding protein